MVLHTLVPLGVVAMLVSTVAPGLGRMGVAASEDLLAGLGLGAWQKRGRVLKRPCLRVQMAECLINMFG
jgi:hypothetical protein